MKAVSAFGALLAPALVMSAGLAQAEQRDEVSYLRGPYNIAFFNRHNDSFRYSAAFHYHHGKEHDVLQLTPREKMAQADHDFNVSVTDFVYGKKAKTEPTMELYGPYTARFAWTLYRTIDWTHMHHEQTYDIMAERSIPWDKKKEWTDRAVRYYLEKNKDIARSIAPLDVTMRRAAVMMKPYFTLYRNYSPESNSVAWVAHWWHPVTYEAQMIAGNDNEQHPVITQMNKTMLNQVFVVRPERMLLSRECMPRYSRMSPESANIFDNLHMLHGIAYDIMSYKGWTTSQKRAELYRVIDAMSYQPGDEKLVRKFPIPHPDLDPRIYYPWMGSFDGEMSRIMREMMMEMMPMMMPDMVPAGLSQDDLAKMKPEEIVARMNPQQRRMHDKMMAQFKMKNMQGIQLDELAGSLHDAMMAMMPDMKMMPGSMEPGKTPQMMVDAMLKGWQAKYADMPDAPGIDMSLEPTAPPLPSDIQTLMASWPDNDQAKPQYGNLARQAMPDMAQTTEDSVRAQLEAIKNSGGARTLDTQGKAGVQRNAMMPPPMMHKSGMKMTMAHQRSHDHAMMQSISDNKIAKNSVMPMTAASDAALRPIPYQGSLPPGQPQQGMPDKMDTNAQAAMDVLYKRPSPLGPPPIALQTPKAFNIVGKNPAIQILPGPSVYLDKVPPEKRETLPEKSAFSNNVKQLAKGEVRLTAYDRTTNDTKLSQDEMALEATFTDHEGHNWKIVQLALAPLSPTPDREPWYGGVATDMLYHGASGKGTPLEPLVQAALLSWGWADIWKYDKKVASSALLHVMVTSDTHDSANGFAYSGYDSTKNPIRQIHLIVPPRTGLPAPGGFLHIMWQNATIERGTPQQVAARPVVREAQLPTLKLNAVPYLKWSEPVLRVPVGQRVKLELVNNDPSSVHAFMLNTPEGHIHVPLPQGSKWVTSFVFDKAGEYKFWCPVANHQKRGMYGRVIVEGGVPGGSFPPAAR